MRLREQKSFLAFLVLKILSSNFNIMTRSVFVPEPALLIYRGTSVAHPTDWTGNGKLGCHLSPQRVLVANQARALKQTLI